MPALDRRRDARGRDPIPQVIGYSDLAKLALAVEADLAAHRAPIHTTTEENTAHHPSPCNHHTRTATTNFHGERDNLHDGSPLPESLTVTRTFELVQMTGEDVAGSHDPEVLTLSSADVPEMLELVRLTEPGPFLERTIELGKYVGIRHDGVLVAMAGERLHFDDWTEISAVCTAPTHRGHGLATRLMSALVADIQRRSERVFLHVLTDNSNAIRLYEQLGFRVRRDRTISVLTRDHC